MFRAVRDTLVIMICAAGLLPVAAFGHGPQIQISIDNQQIVTRALHGDGPYDDALTPIQRVYEMPLAQRALADANDGWYAQPNASFAFTGPGIATALGGFSSGSILSLTFTDGLKLWDGGGFADPGTEQIDAYRGATHAAGAVTSDAGPFQSYSFTAISGSADEHKTAYFRLLGDGVSPNTASDDGVYLLSLQLTSDQPGVGPSLPYCFLLSKNAAPGELAAARSYVNRYLVPEPGAAVLLACGVMAAMRRRRRTRWHDPGHG